MPRRSRTGRGRHRRRSRRRAAAGPMRLLNRGLIAAIVINAGGDFGGGTYEVIWSLFLAGAWRRSRAHRADLRDVRPAGPAVLAVRRPDRGPARTVRVHRPGVVLPAVTGIPYTRLVDPALAVPLILIEATGFALLNPALYAVVAANSPPGRSSTARACTGRPARSVSSSRRSLAGALAAMDILYPFYLFSAVLMVACWSASRSADRDSVVRPARPSAAGPEPSAAPCSGRAVRQRPRSKGRGRRRPTTLASYTQRTGIRVLRHRTRRERRSNERTAAVDRAVPAEHRPRAAAGPHGAQRSRGSRPSGGHAGAPVRDASGRPTGILGRETCGVLAEAELPRGQPA